MWYCCVSILWYHLGGRRNKTQLTIRPGTQNLSGIRPNPIRTKFALATTKIFYSCRQVKTLTLFLHNFFRRNEGGRPRPNRLWTLSAPRARKGLFRLCSYIYFSGGAREVWGRIACGHCLHRELGRGYLDHTCIQPPCLYLSLAHFPQLTVHVWA